MPYTASLDRTLATAQATPFQRRLAILAGLVFLMVTLLLWREAATIHAPIPGFIPVYETAVIIAYALTAYLLLAHFTESRAVSLLWIGAGAFYTAMILVLQLLSFPNVLAPGRLLGSGPETTIWLWAFWHFGPPVYTIGFALAERRAADQRVAPGNSRLMLVAVIASVLALVSITALIVTQWTGLLPTVVQGDNYHLLTTSGIGPATEALTLAALGVVWWATRLRTSLQLWIALSLFALVLDNALTLAGGTRGSIGWTVGRLEALASASLILAVYLHQSGALHRYVAMALRGLAEAHTDLRRAHTQLEAQAATLQATGEDLVAARLAAEQASAAKSRFLASMSHELRTPLTAVVGFCDLLMTPGISDDDRRLYLRLQRDAADALMSQIGGVLDMAKIEAGRMEIEATPFALRALIDSSVALVGPAAGMKRLTLRADIRPGVPEVVLGDRTRLGQVLLNFLSNAVKFTVAGGVTVIVEPLSGETAADHVSLRCTVRDTGIGIPADRLPRLFEEFSQADASTAREFGGTGLGLAVSRELMDLMGGRCGAESVPGQGSSFWFEVALPVVITPDTAATGITPDAEPAVSAHVAPAQRATAGRPPGRSRRILVADDTKANRVLLDHMLRHRGYDVTAVDSGAAAVEAVREGDFGLVLMDMLMPGVDGIAATRAIRCWEGSKWNVPIVAVTANSSADDAALCLAAGIQDVVTKPLDLKLLNAVLERYVPLRSVIDFAAERARLAPATELKAPAQPNQQII